MKRHYLITIFCTILFIQACASQRRADTTGIGEEIFAPQIQEEKITEEPITSEPIYGPELPPEALLGPAVEPTKGGPTKKIPEPKLCLVLGPGLVHGLAHAGVLESLALADIPLSCLLGVETGAIVGALYSLSNNSNTLQWQIFKINEDNYFDRSLFSSKASVKKMHQFFTEIFGDKTFSDLKLRFHTNAFDSVKKEITFFSEKEKIASALSASIAIPDFFEPWLVENYKLISGAMIDPLPIAKAKEVGATTVVAVNVIKGLPENSSELYKKSFARIEKILELEKKQADYVIEPKLQEYALEDFSKRSEIIAAGREAGEDAAEKILEIWRADQERYRCETQPETCMHDN